jgi:hypothetical protein
MADEINKDHEFLFSQKGVCIFAKLLPLFPYAAVSQVKQGE